MPKLLFTTSSFDLNNFRERAVAERAGFELVLNPHGKRLSEAQTVELLQGEVVGIVAGLEPLTQAVLSGAPRLKVIARCGIGMDNVDVLAARRLGISVFNTPDAPTRAVAELTVAHMLALARRVSESDRSVRQGRWQPLMGALLSEQTIGLIGFGRIGKAVGKLLTAFGARLLVRDAAPLTWTHELVQAATLTDLLRQSDIVSLHVPYETETHHLIDAPALALMKPGALLVNAARGGLIDEEALLSALQAKHLGGVALDCFESEPYSGPLLQFENVQVTAHMGSYAREGRAVMEAEACDALMRGLREHALL